MAVTTVVGVPGLWKDHADIVRSIPSPIANPQYLFAGQVIFELATKEGMIMEIRDHDPKLAAAFRAAGAYSHLAESDFEAITKHTYCLYLVDEHGGSLDAARKMMRFASALLRAGGLAVKVESAGKSHTAKEWTEYAKESANPQSLFEAFVVLVGGQRTGYYSCGMHNLGLPDAQVPGTVPNNEAGAILRGFLLYMLAEKPEIRSGNTFSLTADGLIYVLTHGACEQFAEDNVFHNPFGVWELTPKDRGGTLLE